MARHRNVRTMNIDDEYYDDDTVYGHSVPDDDYCISPGTAAQFTFNRERRTDLSSFMGREEIPEEEPEDLDLEEPPGGSRSEVKQPRLSDKDQDHLNGCLEEIRGILADTYPDQMIRDTIIAQDYNTSKALDVLLSQQDAPKPQREPRPNRRNRSQGDDDYDSSDSSSSELSQTVSKDGISNRPGSRESSAPVKLSKNGQVFRFESPLSMLRKAVESRSPPQHTDIPKLVSNRISAEPNTTVVQQGKVAASSNDTASRHVNCLSELIKKRAEGGDTVRREGIRPGLGTMSLTDLIQQNNTIQSEDVPSKIAKLSLTDGTGSKLSSKMLSLADLSLKHSSKANVKNSSKGPSLAELHSKHASKVSSFDLGSKQTSAMSNTLGKQSLTLEELNSKHSSKSPALAEISSKHSPSQPSSLADLSSKHSPSQPSSLADLSSKHSSKRPTLSGLCPGPSPKRPTLTGSAEDSAKQPSLADLSSKHSVKHRFHNPEKSEIREPKSTTNFSGGHTSLSNQKHSTSEPIKIDLTKALLRLNCKDELENQSSGTDKEVSDNLPTKDMQITEEASAEISPMPMLLEVAPVFVSHELQASFSAFGSVLATACIHGDLEKKNNNFPSFSYHRQARPGRKLPSPPADVEACIPFDFSTPSPDDRVKAKQKEAFTGNSRKPLT